MRSVSAGVSAAGAPLLLFAPFVLEAAVELPKGEKEGQRLL